MKSKTNQIIQAAVHAFAQADIMHGRMPDYDDYGIIGFDLLEGGK